MPILDLFTPKVWKAELILVVGYIPRWFACPQIVAHKSTSHFKFDRESTFFRDCRRNAY